MSQLINLRRQIRSIQTTRKITYAMRLISMSLYGRLEKNNKSIEYYQEQISKAFKDLSQHAGEWEHPVLFPKDMFNSTPLFIIITSSKGLCGGFNSNLTKFFKKKFFLEEHQKPRFILIGQKAISFARDFGLTPAIKTFDDFNTSNYMHIADNIVDILNNEEHTFSSVTVYSNFFKNFFVQQPATTEVTPIQRNDEENQETDAPILEQNISEVMDFLAVRYLKSVILNLLFQSILSEQASRFLAMDNATTNANKFIDKLTLKYNKARQALITKELAELSASFGKY